jgi:pimeloyl-ACP methyl ester carboxylesterase
VSTVSSPSAQDAPDAYGPVGRSPWLDIDWRTHQRWVVVDDRPVNVIELGHGPPLLFVHGLAGSWPNWLEQLPVFASDHSADHSAGGSAIGGGHRVIALDLPGFGHSPMPTGPISITGYARTLDALLDSLEVDAAAVVGHSMGGFTAAEFAINFPQRVERLVLVSPAGLSTYGDPRGLRELRRISRMERTITAIVTWGATNAEFLASRPGLRNIALDVVARHPDRLPAPLAAEQIRGAGKPGFLPALQANLDYDFRHRLPEIACPTLIVWGTSDRVVTVRDADAYAELIPNSRSVILPDTGHFLQVERPAAFNTLLEEFLEE